MPRLKLVKVSAHRFAGIHAYGEPGSPPEDFTFEPHNPATLFEGWNGAGKTSLLNAIVWCLTGEILRPQRAPESALNEFDATFSGTSSDGDVRAHSIPPGKGEAGMLASAQSLNRIVTAYRVREDSAIPLALPGQVLLGGDDIPANVIGTMEGQLVALTLADGAGVLKRVGPALASPLSNFRQFESIGGLGDSLIVCTADDGHQDLPTFASARVVLGVLYTA